MKFADSIHQLFYPNSHRTRRRREWQEIYIAVGLGIPAVVLAGLLLYYLQDRLAQ